jgi:hypothetical protein|tara:strand:+ start:971 stop:1570 length:600 start_codon:yes stop_codon:yes gene_type:complete
MPLKERHQVLAWKDTPVDKQVVTDLIYQAIKRMPSKQCRRRINITLIDTSIGKRKEILYHTTLPQPIEFGHNNPQILAPWVLALGQRKEAWDKTDVNYEWFLQEVGVEMGFITGYISLLAPNIGLGTGFCGCIHDNSRNNNGIGNILGYDPMLFLGIGIEDPDATEFYCYKEKKMQPINHKERLNRDFEPPIEEFFKCI